MAKKITKAEKRKRALKAKRQSDSTKYDKLNAKTREKYQKIGKNPESFQFFGTPGEIKLSAAVLKLAEPYIKRYWGNEDRVRAIVSLAIMGWNMSHLPVNGKKPFRDNLCTKLGIGLDSDQSAEIYEFIDAIARTKNQLYPQIKSLIVSHDLRIHGDKITLDVSSTPFTL